MTRNGQLVFASGMTAMRDKADIERSEITIPSENFGEGKGQLSSEQGRPAYFMVTSSSADRHTM